MEVDPFEQQLRDKLRTSEQDLDGPTLSRLHQARSKALEHGNQNPLFQHRWLFSAATACLLAVAVVLVPSSLSPEQTEKQLLAALEPGLQQDIELYENLEFYEWLAAQEAS